jgi:hypothetical protein
MHRTNWQGKNLKVLVPEPYRAEHTDTLQATILALKRSLGSEVSTRTDSNKVLHPLTTTVLFAMPVHPSSYHMLSRYLWRSYPYPGRKTPPWVQRLLQSLIDTSGSPPADSSDALLRDVGWITRETTEDREKLHASTEPDIQY